MTDTTHPGFLFGLGVFIWWFVSKIERNATSAVCAVHGEGIEGEVKIDSIYEGERSIFRCNITGLAPGFHGFHVFSGVILNIIIFINVLLGTYEKRGHYDMVEKVGLYWHFVDLVWVFVFTFFYLV